MLHLLVLSSWLVYMAPEAGAVQRCPHYSQPKNGRIVCDSLFRLFCAPECAPGHVFAFRPAVVYMCAPVTGDWYTYPPGHALPWPNCVKETGDQSESYAMDQVNAKRMEISKRISRTQEPIFPKSYTASQQNNRYQHLYKYVERARQAYQNRRKTTDSVTSQTGHKIDTENRQTQRYLENSSNTFSDANSSNVRQREMRDTELEKTNQFKSYRKNAPNTFSISVDSATNVSEIQDTELQKRTPDSDLETASNKFNKRINLSNEAQRESQETGFENRMTSDPPQKESYVENVSKELSTLADSYAENRPTSGIVRVQSDLSKQRPRITAITDEEMNSPGRTQGEKLFYFPIKRDALIRMLPKDLHEKYLDLQQNTAKQAEPLSLQNTNLT